MHLDKTVTLRKSLPDLLPPAACYLDKDRAYRLADKTCERYSQVATAVPIDRHPREIRVMKPIG